MTALDIEPTTAAVIAVLAIVVTILCTIRHLRAERVREFNDHVDTDLGMIAADRRSAGLEANATTVRWQG